jgi:hypothetical protein
MSVGSAIVVAAVGSLAGLGALRVARAAGVTCSAQRGPIRGLRGGYVEIEGVATGHHTRTAPLSGREALAWWLVVEEERGPLSWRRLLTLHDAVDFTIRDASGAIAIPSGGPRLQPDLPELRGHAGPFDPLPRQVESLLQAHQHETHGVLFGRAFRWREQVLSPGQSIRARGWVDRRPVDAEHEAIAAVAGHVFEAGYRGLEETLVWVDGPTGSLQLVAGTRAAAPWVARRRDVLRSVLGQPTAKPEV